MARHRLSPEAAVELDEIWLHVALETGEIEIADPDNIQVLSEEEESVDAKLLARESEGAPVV